MKMIRYQSLTASLVATPAPAPAPLPTSPSAGLPAVQRFLQTDPATVVAVATEVETAIVDLGVRPLTAEERAQADPGLGLIAEQAQGLRGAEVLRLCPEVPGAAERAAALDGQLGTLSALQSAEPAAEAFARQTAAAAQAAAVALQCAVDAIAEGLRGELATAGLRPEDRAALEQDLRSVTVPFEAEEAQKVESRARGERNIERVREEGRALRSEADYQDTLAALQRGEAPSLDELRAARAHQARGAARPRAELRAAPETRAAARRAGRRSPRR